MKRALMVIALVVSACSSGGEAEEPAATTGVERTTTTTEAPAPAAATTSTSTSTTSSTTTTSTTDAPTTTVDPSAEADYLALGVLSGIESGDASEVIVSIIDALEPFTLDRVDVLTADVANANLVIVGPSGYGTEEFQLDAAIEAVAVLSDLWTVEAFQGLGQIRVGLDLTVDGRHWVIPNESMVAVATRRMTPEAALGL